MEARQAPPPLGPLPPNETRAPEYIAVITVFFFLSLLFFAARIYTRAVMKTIWWDDMIISLGVMVCLVDWIIQILTARYNFGRHVYYVSLSDLRFQLKLAYFALIIWAWSVILVKTSVALMLLHLKRERVWRWVMVPFLLFQLATGVVATIIHFARCRNIAGNWDFFLPNAHCWGLEQTETSYYVLSGLFITSDIIFALLPMTFIFTLHRPLRERVVLVILMGFGIFATACTIVKLTLLHSMMVSMDPPYEAVTANIWTRLELYVGIIAACIPCLKSLFEKFLRHFGLLSVSSHYVGSSVGNIEENEQTDDTRPKSDGSLGIHGSDVDLVPYPQTDRITPAKRP